MNYPILLFLTFAIFQWNCQRKLSYDEKVKMIIQQCLDKMEVCEFLPKENVSKFTFVINKYISKKDKYWINGIIVSIVDWNEIKSEQILKYYKIKKIEIQENSAKIEIYYPYDNITCEMTFVFRDNKFVINNVEYWET